MYKFIEKENGLYIESYTGKEYNVKIPSHNKDGKPIIGISNKAFHKNEYIEKVTLPNTIKQIDEYAFEGCKNLTQLNINKNLEIIGKGAFANTNLKEVTLNKKLKKICSYAFFQCEKLEKVNFESDVFIEDKDNSKIFGNCTKLKEIKFNKLSKSFNLSILDDCSALEKINIEDGDYIVRDNIIYTKASNYMIYYPQGLRQKKYEIPKGTKGIETWCFYKNRYIKEIIMNDEIINLECQCIKDCPGLEKIVFSENLKVFDFTMLDNLERLKELDFTKSKITTFNSSYIVTNKLNGVKKIKLPNTITENLYIDHLLKTNPNVEIIIYDYNKKLSDKIKKQIERIKKLDYKISVIDNIELEELINQNKSFIEINRTIKENISNR